MSGIAGVFARDGHPVAAQVLSEMLRATGHRSREAPRCWSDGLVALGHCGVITVPEGANESQPLSSADGQLRVVFDGRIDNRAELDAAFEQRRIRREGESDAAYVLASYRLWLHDCPSRILGDFAFAIWDAAERRLFCARDVLAIKPFYYACTPRLFVFGSERATVLAHPAVSHDINEAMVGEYLSVVTSVEETLFRDVRRLPRASRLTVSRERATVEKYWEIGGREIRYRTEDEYCEHLRALLREAVRARMRSTTPVGVMLSGGVDSSSITALGASFVRTGAARVSFDAFSFVERGGDLDESVFIEQAARRHDVRLHTFPGDTPPLESYRRIARQRADVPPSPNDRLFCTLRRSAADCGTRVLLSGIFGDEWFSGSFYHGADLLRQRRWLALARYVRTQSRFADIPRPGPLAKILLWPQLPRAARRRVKQLIGRTGVPPFVRPDFARRTDLADRLYPACAEPPLPTIAQRSIFEEMTGGVSTLTIEEQVRVGSELGVETRYPFADRRILEFGMNIPEDLRFRDGVRKYVLRRAMEADLPEAVVARRSSPDASARFLPTLRALFDEGAFDSPSIERAGWVDAAGVRALYRSIVDRHARGDDSFARDVWPLWSIAAVEMWMREVVEGNKAEDSWLEASRMTAAAR